MVNYLKGRYEAKRTEPPMYGMGVMGYGRKIALPYKIKRMGENRWRRVYCCCYSNAGTCYVVIKGEWQVLCDIELREALDEHESAGVDH